MKINKKQEALLKRLNNRIIFKLVSIFKLPMAIVTNLKIEEINLFECRTSVKYNYLNKNPFKSTYFAVQSMAAELSTGALALLTVDGLNSDVSFILVGNSARFIKKAKEKTVFICNEGDKLHKAVARARSTNEQIEETVKTIGYDSNEEIISEFKFTWSFRIKSSDLILNNN